MAPCVMGWRKWRKALIWVRKLGVSAEPAAGQKIPQATPAANDDIASPLGFPAVGCKKITAAFDGGQLTSDGGVVVLAQAERAVGICQQLAAYIAEPRDP
jgi:hypothetical protein